MNKELTKKYKAEFDAWVEGKSLLYKTTTSNVWVQASSIDISGLFSNPSHYIKAIIIDDSYVIYRKALAEGKTIQVWDIIEQHLTDPKLDVYDWRDFKSFTQSSPFTYSPDRYRIKPEEPQFKVGDWVRNSISRSDIGKVLEFTDEGYSKTVCLTHNEHCFLQWEHWKPRPGELVILKDKNDIISIIKYNGETNVYPFIGEITWLHKKD